MAQKTITSLIDDLDGGEADESMTYGLDGTTYEIDLSEKNATILREALAPYVVASRRVGGGSAIVATRKPRPSTTAGTGDGVDTAKVREWARSQGIAVSSRGRIAATIVESYKAGHGG